MATASVSITPECSICFEILKTPKFIPCGHTFCLGCLERYICDKTERFLCPICQQDVKIPDGGARMFTTNFILQTSPHTTQVTGTPTSPQTSEITDQPVKTLKHHCQNHSKKEVEFYCQTCSLGLCSKCIYRDHKDHKTLDLECDSTREMVAEEMSKSEKFVKNKIVELFSILATLLHTPAILKSSCGEACTKIREKTDNTIIELNENCEKRQQEMRDNFDKNKSQLTKTRRKVMTMITNIKTNLETSCPTTTEEPSLTLIYSLTKLQNLQKLCEKMKTDIPPVTYVEWIKGKVQVCDILGSTVTKPLYQSRQGSEPISTVTKPLYQSREGSGPIPTKTKLLYQSSEGSGPIPDKTKLIYQSSEGSEPIPTKTKPLHQSSEGSGPISTATKPLHQSSEGSGPISTVTKPLHQSSEGSRPISTATKPLHQSSEGSGTVSTVTKPPYQSREGSGPIPTKTKLLYQTSKGSGPISTVTKPLYPSSEGSGPISTVTKPLDPSSEGSGPISTVTKPLYQSREGNVFRFNYKHIKTDSFFKSKDRYSSQGVVWSCTVRRCGHCTSLQILIHFIHEDNLLVDHCEIKYNLTLINKDKDKNVVSRTGTKICSPYLPFREFEIEIQWDKLSNPSEGFIDNEGQFLVKLDILQVIDIKYKHW